MKIYHYVRAEDWNDIKNGSYLTNDQPGLGANRRVGREDTEAWNTGAVFGLLDPLPKEWTENEHFKASWQYLKHDIGGRVLLEIDIDENDPNVFVIDRGLMEGILYKEKETIPEKYLFPNKKDAEGAYIKSKVLLKEYLEKQHDLNYSLPEVIITEHIPFEKIKISELQPFIEEDLKDGKKASAIMELAMRKINLIPELAQWYKKKQDSEGKLNTETNKRLR